MSELINCKKSIFLVMAGLIANVSTANTNNINTNQNLLTKPNIFTLAKTQTISTNNQSPLIFTTLSTSSLSKTNNAAKKANISSPVKLNAPINTVAAKKTTTSQINLNAAHNTLTNKQTVGSFSQKKINVPANTVNTPQYIGTQQKISQSAIISNNPQLSQLKNVQSIQSNNLQNS